MTRKIILPLLLLTNLSHSLDLPEEMILEYSGPYGIPAKLTFNHDHKNYTIDTNVAIPFKNMRFKTKGIIKNNQLLPTEYTVYRGNKAYSSASFNYNDQKITYGKLPERKNGQLKSNTQDLFTVAWQMSINNGLPLKNTHATDGKRVYELPALRQVNNIQHKINNKKENSLYFKGGENDRQLEVGLATNLHYVPSVIVYYDKGKRYELTLKRLSTKVKT